LANKQAKLQTAKLHQILKYIELIGTNSYIKSQPVDIILGPAYKSHKGCLCTFLAIHLW